MATVERRAPRRYIESQLSAATRAFGYDGGWGTTSLSKPRKPKPIAMTVQWPCARLGCAKMVSGAKNFGKRYCSIKCKVRARFINNRPKLLANQRAHMAAWTPERRKQDNAYKRGWYAKQSPEWKARLNERNNERARLRRASEAPEQRKKRLERRRATALMLTSEQLETRRAKDRAYYRRRAGREGAFWRAAYAAKSPEKRAKGSAWRSQWRRAKVAAESPEQREQRLKRQREQMRALRQKWNAAGPAHRAQKAEYARAYRLRKKELGAAISAESSAQPSPAGAAQS